MASASSTTTSSSAPNDTYAGSAAMKYIQGLHAKLTSIESQLQTATQAYNNAVTNESTIQDSYGTASTFYESLQKNLDDAHKARESLSKVGEFFQKQLGTAQDIEQRALSMATSMGDATMQLIRVGVAPVNATQALIKEGEAAEEDASDVKFSWKGTPFSTSVDKAVTIGKTALESCQAASKSALNAYASAQSISARTASYNSSVKNYVGMLDEVINRLVTETGLAKLRLDNLQAELDRATLTTATAKKRMQDLTNQKDRYQSEYNAASQGASYSAPAGKIPA